MQWFSTRTRPFAVNSAIAKYLRVKISGGFLLAAGVGASDDTLEVGVMLEASATSGPNSVTAPVILRTCQGTCPMVANGAIAAGVAVYGAAAGQIATTVSGTTIGIALDAAASSGDIIEVLRY